MSKLLFFLLSFVLLGNSSALAHDSYIDIDLADLQEFLRNRQIQRSKKERVEALTLTPEQKEVQTFGRKITALTFDEVKEILLDKRIYEGEMEQKNFKTNGISSEQHPYSFFVQTQCIVLSKTTKSEKETLWNLLLYRNFAKNSLFYHHGYNGTNPKKLDWVYSYTPDTAKSLCVEKPLKESITNYLTFGTIGAAIGFVAYTFVRCAYLDLFRSKKVFKVAHTTAEYAYGTWEREWLEGFRFIHKPTLTLFILGFGALFAKLSKDESPYPDAAKNVEKLVTIHTKMIEKLTKEETSFPAHFIEDLNLIRENLATYNYKPNNSFDQEEFKAYLETLFEYYKNLGKKAGVIPATTETDSN
jgi:hypothetical protein